MGVLDHLFRKNGIVKILNYKRIPKNRMSHAFFFTHSLKQKMKPVQLINHPMRVHEIENMVDNKPGSKR